MNCRAQREFCDLEHPVFYIFNQILKVLPREVINRIVLEEKSDRYYKSFSTWDELTSLLFGVYTRCDSAREVCDGMAALGGKLRYAKLGGEWC